MELFFDLTFLDDLTIRLNDLGKLFSSPYQAKAKGQQTNAMVQDAQIHAFLFCHATFFELLKSIYEQSHHFYDEVTSQDEALYFALKWLEQEHIITGKQFDTVLSQFQSSIFLWLDKNWIVQQDERK